VSTPITSKDIDLKDLDASLACHGSNVREIFFDLYDRHERKRRAARTAPLATAYWKRHSRARRATSAFKPFNPANSPAIVLRHHNIATHLLLFVTFRRTTPTSGLHFNGLPYRRSLSGKTWYAELGLITFQPATLGQSAKLAQHALFTKCDFAACS
jgi:hypothetical protein